MYVRALSIIFHPSLNPEKRDRRSVVTIKRRIRLLHTADLHLGSPLKSIGQTSGRLGELLLDATFTVMKRICDLAIMEQVDFMVISGDLYDREARSIKAGYFLREQFQRLADYQIPVFIIAGNHDPLSEDSGFIVFPQNVYVFGCDETEYRDVLDTEGEVIARVIGRSYKSRFATENIIETYGALGVVDDEVWNIALLHTALEPDKSHYLPCTARELANVKGIDYWALGHTHSVQVVHKDPLIVYPGIPQGRAPDEAGRGGCLIVDLIPGEEGRVEFVPVSPVVWRIEEVGIDSNPVEPPENIDDVVALLKSRAEELLAESSILNERLLLTGGDDLPRARRASVNRIAGYIVRWILSGRGEVHRQFTAQEEETVETLLAALRPMYGTAQVGETPFIWSETVKLRTGLPLPELDDLQTGDETFQELDRVIKELCTEEGLKQVTGVLGEVWEEGETTEDYNPLKMQYSKDKGPNSLTSLIEDAKRLVIEEIMKGRAQ
jgi:exonuclease SbcD